MTSGFRGDLLRDDAWRSRGFAGQRVAVVASAEEAARIVPHVVRTATSVKVFQRSPAWVLPTRVPLPAGPIRRRAARLHLRLSVRDQWLRRQLTPFGDQPGVVVRPGFYAALQQPGCKLYTWPVYAIVEHGVRSAEGVEHRVDVVILGADVEVDCRVLREERTA
ncbi:FAD-dependent oxidoreductase [Nocardioides pelophilus]|uniref:FAD-dependent oxidoreductase n=1 Tax=Nocardioides pelophilus TaxID=2172019 RepID=UPI00160479B5|nr:FAD-dependent oxidoreductase [Nocardioides pelophilus]